MRVKALKAFVARVNGKSHSVVLGQELDLPPGVNWVEEGLVQPVDGQTTPAKRRTKATSKKASSRSKR
jgi:hypothetical protein